MGAKREYSENVPGRHYTQYYRAVPREMSNQQPSSRTNPAWSEKEARQHFYRLGGNVGGRKLLIQPMVYVQTGGTELEIYLGKTIKQVRRMLKDR